MSAISIQVLDGMQGRPAPGVLVRLECHDETRWNVIVSGVTSDDGRLPELACYDVGRGRHQLVITPSRYFAGLGIMAHYREFTTEFQGDATGADMHVTCYLTTAAFATFWQQV
ncbi:MAG TPA: hydroxyisourate hydrolase [Micromonosporaceae bacterium]